MKLLNHSKTIIAITTCVVVAGACFTFQQDEIVDYSTDVKPIINSKCITCHGGVKAKSKFSLLFREDAMGKTESGKPAIVPGHPERSEMIRRIKHNDPEERMPYKHQPLSGKEIDILEAWIRQGAKWGDHWAYLPVKQIPVPETDPAKRYNDIDNFIIQKQEEQELKPSPEASKETLLRRVSLDLTGTMPTASLAKKYLSDNSPNAYESLVDSLLASPRYGERWASVWLDIARYADTKGYEADVGRNIWKYRDWVIDAFNTDKPYNIFLTEQIAGDLFPQPTNDQYIATAFHRNSMTNDEGGTNNEEFRTAAVLDRVNTTWESLMGTTFACVQCHSHPYDPFRHDEYYKFMAYFNDTRDEDANGDFPLLRQFNDTAREQIAQLTSWVKSHSSPDKAMRVDRLVRTLQPSMYSGGVDSLKNALILNNNGDLLAKDQSFMTYRGVDMENVGQLIVKYYSNSPTGTLKVFLDKSDGPLVVSKKLNRGKEWQTAIIEFPAQKGIHDVYISYLNPIGRKEDEAYFSWFSFTPDLPGAGALEYARKKQLFKKLILQETDGTPVMVENEPSMHRTSNVFERGNWNTKGAVVNSDVPAIFKFAMPKNAPKNRMGLAMWLINEKNPLVSRTLVNRFWEQLFGTGIVETLEDMGTQGILPTHRELLDYLSYNLMHSWKWSTKTLLKQMVMSKTYRQDSKTNPELIEKDPYNKWLSRGPRLRLSAEQLRDQHLQISGMLSTKMHGPGVMPWQPDGIWVSPYNNARWQTDSGENHYRRAIYTYWKRSSPYPSLIAFDAPQRNICSARRIRTNTPIQALVTLNDSVYIDLARHFSLRLKKEAGNTPASQIEHGYELMLYKKIPKDKLEVMLTLFNKAKTTFEKDKKAMKELAGKSDPDPDPSSAAMVVVANAMLNLDEIVTKN